MTGMDHFKELLRDMSAGELIEFLMVGKERRQADSFFWLEQVEEVLGELKGRLKNDERMDIQSLMKMIRQFTY
ncbi:MAG: hypothetical protein ACOZF0_10625 [Thermodesulfobacteriota bacterium]